MKTRICFLPSVLLFLVLFSCQDPAFSLIQHNYPLFFSMGAHSLTVPWHLGPVNDRLNPALIVGTERTLKSGRQLLLYHTGNLGFFRHYWWMTGVFLNTEAGVRRALPLRLHADVRLGIGYLHFFWRRKTLELKNGHYEDAADWGKPSLMIPLSFMLGYRDNVSRSLPVSPFIVVQWAVQGIFLKEIPVMTHLFLLIGARIELGGVTQTSRR